MGLSGAERVRAVIFDLDGTLADSQLDFAAMRRESSCPDDLGLLEFIDSLADPAEKERVANIIHCHEMAGARRATWIEGAQALCHQLTENDIPLAIFTRNSREAASYTVEALAIPHQILIAREDAPAKPDPTGLLAITEALDIDVDEALYVGDYLYDLQAAANAGMRSCLYDAGECEAFRDQADIVVTEFQQLASLLFNQSA